MFLFFDDRRIRGPLINAVRYGGKLAETTSQAFVWLCATNAGVDYVNRTVLFSLGLLDTCLRHGFPADPNAGQSSLFLASPGLAVRLMRNLDKDRGFVNGAMGHVETILAYDRDRPTVFTVKLSATGVLVLVHPIWHDRQMILPCTYGYATTIRRAQGATYHHGCLYFDHRHPPEPGYGYLAASRFKSRSGVYLFGKVRRTDFIPVHEPRHRYNYHQERSEESDSDYASGDEAAAAEDYDHYQKYGLDRDEDAELSDGYGSDSSQSINDDDIQARIDDDNLFFSTRRAMRQTKPGVSICDFVLHE